LKDAGSYRFSVLKFTTIQGAPDDYIKATGVSLSVRELAQLAFAEVGLDRGDYVTVDDPFKRPADVSDLAADIDSCTKERS